MERLTKKVDGVWTALCNYGSSPYPVVTQEIIDRLAAYEDTSLTPEEVQQMRWIPVEERLPEKHSEYIVCACDEGEPIDERIWGDTEYDISDIVTHWMPLPKPPKEGTNGKH